MKEEIIDHIQDLKDQVLDVKINEDQINDLMKRILYRKDAKDKKDKKNTYIDSEIDKFIKEYENKNISISYGKNKLSTEKINESFKKFHNKLINFKEFENDYDEFRNNAKNLTKDQKEMKEYIKK